MNEQDSLADLARRDNVPLAPGDYRLIELDRDLKSHARRFGKTEDQVWEEIDACNSPKELHESK